MNKCPYCGYDLLEVITIKKDNYTSEAYQCLKCKRFFMDATEKEIEAEIASMLTDLNDD